MPNLVSDVLPNEAPAFQTHRHWAYVADPLVVLVAFCVVWWLIPGFLASQDPSALIHIPVYERFSKHRVNPRPMRAGI